MILYNLGETFGKRLRFVEGCWNFESAGGVYVAVFTLMMAIQDGVDSHGRQPLGKLLRERKLERDLQNAKAVDVSPFPVSGHSVQIPGGRRTRHRLERHIELRLNYDLTLPIDESNF